MESFTPVSAAVGGALIGLAATLLLWLNGRIAGISGIAGGLFTGERKEMTWRALFLAGTLLEDVEPSEAQAAFETVAAHAPGAAAPMATASSAMRTCSAPASASE